MKQNRLMFAFGLSALMAGPQMASAISADNPYVGTITNRNLFSLKPPPDPASLVPQVAPPPLPDVKLAGITTLMGTTRAILRVMRPAKPPEPAKEISLFLTPGSAAEDGVQVTDIDVAHGLVKIMNSGTAQTLDITKNAPKSAAAPAVAPPGMPPPPPPPGGVIPAPQAGGAPSVTSIGRPMRTGQNGVVGGGPNQMGNPSAADQAQPVSAETAALTYAAWTIRDKAKVDAGELPPYPHNEATEIIDQEQHQQQQQQSGPPRF